jgi:hypothetical protein
MPYIKQENRPLFDGPATLIGNDAKCAGDLNYAITVIVHTYLKKKGINYANLNEVHGMLNACNMELYRAVTGPYESIKVNENGPVGIIKEFGVSPAHEHHPGQQTLFEK